MTKARTHQSQRLLRRVYFSVYLLFLALASCTRGLDIELFNDTGTNLVVICYDTAGAATSKDLPMHASVRITGSEFVVQSGSVKWRYTLIGHSPPESLIDRTHFNALVNLQIESNGDVFILSPNVATRPLSLPTQPQGYPIHPQSPAST